MKYPAAFVERMAERLGAELPAFLEALERKPLTTIRLNPYKPYAMGEGLLPVPWHPEGRILPQRPDFAQEIPWYAGAYYVQEAASMSVRAFLPPRGQPWRVIDLSAAPGGKSTLLLSEIGLTGGLLIANEPDPHRRKALQQNLERWGVPAYILTGRDPAWWAQNYPAAFDLVLLDAPCSGEGLWRKDPALAQTWRTETVSFSSRRQRRLLAAAMDLVAPGGRLVYATCTFAPEENEENLAALFAERPDWQPVRWSPLPHGIVEVSYAGDGWGYYFYPHRTIGEGFFISAWEKAPALSRPAKSMRSAPTSLRVEKRSPVPLEGPLVFFSREGTGEVLTETAWRLIPPHLSRFQACPVWRYHKPTHAAALCQGLNPDTLPIYELLEAEWPLFLNRQPFPTTTPYAWVHWKGLGLGWLYKGRPSMPPP